MASSPAGSGSVAILHKKLVVGKTTPQKASKMKSLAEEQEFRVVRKRSRTEEDDDKGAEWLPKLGHWDQSGGEAVRTLGEILVGLVAELQDPRVELRQFSADTSVVLDVLGCTAGRGAGC
ncbi:hypothetical protein HYDPIDRAFT_169976 [Hydnomerulius pinastri MD-312]|uniref:Unplaced genomic scaffold scaffold_33, whole genome shotgun sequence n=1 Tax=Hydnomerulius pinastri MD-312 TaxID=994086 RepID=A0A0C9W3U1_9AGAM|nr:hypothetical protein HYDPIDRAFT_169976 [Hydnomerulius pinastri MD-312]